MGIRLAAVLGGLVGVVLLSVGAGFAAASPVTSGGRRGIVLRTPAEGKIAVATLRFRVPAGARPPKLRLARRYARPSTAAFVLGVARVVGSRTSYVALVAIINFRASGEAGNPSAQSSSLYVTADHRFVVDYVGDAERYRGTMKRLLRGIGSRALRVSSFGLPASSIDPSYRDSRGLLDQVRKVLIGLPDARFLADVRGVHPVAPPPASPPPPATPPPPTPPPALTRLSADPFTNVSSQHRTEVEPDSFAYGGTIVSAFQVGRFYDGGASDIGFATSANSWVTWTTGFLPGITKVEGSGTFDRVSDPSVAYDARHDVWLIESLAMNQTLGVAVLVSRSADGGFTWSTPVTVGTGANLDKSWIVCDNHAASPFYGNCYSEWDDVANAALIKMSTSTDGGLNWASALDTNDNATGFAGQPVVQPSGQVIVPILNANSTAMLEFRSINGGTSWSDTVTVASVSDHTVAGGLRTEPLPSAEVDATGTVYLVWQDCRFRPGCTSNDIVMSTTTDGDSWSTVHQIPIDSTASTVDHFIPGIGVDPASSGATAKLALAYYYYPDASCDVGTCRLDVGFVSSADGGATWSSSSQLAGPMALSWLASTSKGLMVGDYISTSFVGGVAHPLFAVAHAPSDAAAFDEAIYTR